MEVASSRRDTWDYAVFEEWERRQGAPADGWTVVIPYFNERHYLPQTLASLSRQTVPFDLVLVDNGSTDGSAEVARATCAALGLLPVMLCEPRRGKVAALATGLADVETRYVATCDADTWYPADYLAAATSLLEQPGTVAAGAFYAAPERTRAVHALAALKIVLAGKLLRGQCHAGGAGQVFRTAVLRAAGSYDPRRWNLVLEDHEIAHQVMKRGRMTYGARLWCAPSTRHRDRDSVSWNVFQRVVYHAVAGMAPDWYFQRFLGPRLGRRNLSSERLRERIHLVREIGHASPHPVR